MSAGTETTDRVDSRFRHEALLYEGPDGFVEAVASFARDAVAADEPILIMVNRTRLEQLRAVLGDDTPGIAYADMEAIGANPARIIPAWREFVDAHAAPGVAQRGVGEPIWSGTDDDRLVESQHHEALLNVAFAADTAMWLVCPYDVSALAPDVIAEALHTHPLVTDDLGTTTPSINLAFGEPDEIAAATLADPLPELAGAPVAFAFDISTLRDVRDRAAAGAARAGLGKDRTDEFVLAVGEVATNSLHYGDGHGTMRVAITESSVVCEIRDSGVITEPLVGRARRAVGEMRGHGLWVVNQLCDLVQVRSTDAGTIVRVSMRRPLA